jgi:hypothetical protein
MSATNRSKNREENHAFDFYKTPDWIIKDLFDNLDKMGRSDHGLFQHLAKTFGVLDPCSGGDENHKAAYPVILQNKTPSINNIVKIDIREDSDSDFKTDFLSLDVDSFLDEVNESHKFGVVISNPPFNLAQEFIQKAHEVVVENGYIIFLLRMGFMGSEKRFQFLTEQYKPYCIFSHHKRPSFTDDGKTDADYYQHVIWKNDGLEQWQKSDTRFFLI